MPDSPLGELQRHLIRSGVSPRHVRRSIEEIREHLEDLETDAVADGLSKKAATHRAYERMGDLQQIGSDIISRVELKAWPYRYPNAARVLLPLAYLVLLPATPLFAGVANARIIARWSACLMLSAVVTVAIFLAMQMSIAIA